MGLHEDFMEQNPEKLMGIFRGLLEAPAEDMISSPTIFDGYPGLAAMAHDAEQLLREVGHTPAEADNMSLGLTLGLIVLARHAQVQIPGNEHKYPMA
jgi:hypothetical protein